ncbi:coiled-coil-helix-coiled-coil-helix domain-containing protein 10, mitochondrial-like [Anopheles aquasalis]|uniref:coiled-coil-helix-coiled-coil-helix domain-containing protein 10, mitochondrial-like n=1 Tax=Anopheles aquasalis TaxID=42839 RepID=UPI00215B71A2|nr:coiled-coil-helix-coiled-coil-helix domain-containing protein 10, mitochondrial-like [Anopheles aquasalis]
MPRRQSHSGSSPRDTSRTSSPKSSNTAKSSMTPPHTTEQPKEATTKSSNIPAPGSGMFAQMAATAGGVAIGSVLGRAFGGLFERSGAETQRDEENAESIGAQVRTDAGGKTAVNEHQLASDDCNWEIKQFLACIDEQRDTKLCEGFKEAMHQCKLKKSPIEMSMH